jgi:oligoendopeptidase F
VDDPDLAGAAEEVAAGVDRLRALYDLHGIGAQEPRPVTESDHAALAEVLTRTNEQLARQRRVGAYLYGLVTTDATDDDAAAHQAALQQRTAALGPLQKRLEAWVASLGAEPLVASGGVAADHAFHLR